MGTQTPVLTIENIHFSVCQSEQHLQWMHGPFRLLFLLLTLPSLLIQDLRSDVPCRAARNAHQAWHLIGVAGRDDSWENKALDAMSPISSYPCCMWRLALCRACAGEL